MGHWLAVFIFHRLVRMLTRYLRKQRMLERGKKVQGALKKNPSLYVEDGRPNLVAMQHMSAAGGLVANWDYRSMTNKAGKMQGRVAGMLSKRSSGAAAIPRTVKDQRARRSRDKGETSRDSQAPALAPLDGSSPDSVRV